MNRELSIGTRLVGAGHPTYIVAEMSANHLMNLRRAHAIIDAAADAGADAIKLQTYTADTITLNSDKSWFQINQGTIWDGTTLHKLYEEAYTPWEWQPELKQHAESLGIDCFSSPFDPTSVEFLEEMGVPAYKIASFEITDIPLIRMVARTGKPIILATGVALLEDIERAVIACREEGNDRIVLLKCTSAYPCPYEAVNLRSMPILGQAFDAVTGLSDHTMGHEIAVAAVALGASMVEKHITLSRADGGPDGAFSMEPREFAAMVDGIRHVERALGRSEYHLADAQVREREHARSLFACADIKAGELLTAENVKSVRPGFGLNPMHYDVVIGRRAACDISYATPLTWEMVS